MMRRSIKLAGVSFAALAMAPAPFAAVAQDGTAAETADQAVDEGYVGNEINVYTPEWTATGGVQYAFDLGETGTLTPRMDVSCRSRVEFPAVGVVAPPRTLLPTVKRRFD